MPPAHCVARAPSRLGSGNAAAGQTAARPLVEPLVFVQALALAPLARDADVTRDARARRLEGGGRHLRLDQRLLESLAAAFPDTLAAEMQAMAARAPLDIRVNTLRATREPASDEFIAAVAALYRRAHARRAAIALLANDAGGPSETAVQLRLLRERQSPSDADLIRSAALAHALRREHG